MDRSWRLTIATGLGVFAIALATYSMVADEPTPGVDPWRFHWAGLILSLLMGLIAGGLARTWSAPTVTQFSELASDAAAPPPPFTRATWVWIAAGSAIGVAIIPIFADNAAVLFRVEFWDLRLAWSVGLNVALFGSMGALAEAGVARNRWISGELAPQIPIDLLDLSPLSAFGRSGVETAGFWLAGSSLAALLFIAFPFSLLHTIILSVTVALGTAELLSPMRGVRRRVQAVQNEELSRVRGEIRTARSGTGSADRLPGLLAWERRVDEINAWPFDIGSALRFGALGAMAIASWLGGALIERVVESALGN